MTDHLSQFFSHFLHANTWELRKDGVPLDLIDSLSAQERIVAEAALIEKLDLSEDWPIHGLAKLQSQKALPRLYDLLLIAKPGMKVNLAYAIYRICRGQAMIPLVTAAVPQIESEYQLIDIMYLLPEFKDSRTDALLQSLREDSRYLVAYNAARAMSLSTDPVVEKFRSNKTN
jgi:hypothetical protein